MLAEITGMAVGGDVRRPTEKMMSVGEALANMSIYEAINSPELSGLLVVIKQLPLK
jgi:hypothetical protein